ncbi:DUF5602 domain-containing protein [Spirosoma flavus]
MKQSVYLLIIAVFLNACSKSDSVNQPQRVYGPSLKMGNGTAKAWLMPDAQGNPASIGFTLSKGAFENLPATLPETDFMLALPDEATSKTPYKHVMINWNPQGHEPAGIYTVPHFDFHFYMQPMNEVMAIPVYSATTAAKFDKVPASAYLPTDFVKGPGGVPMMGAHWSDMTSPEFKGSPFTETFVYGSYDGHVTFWEQMVAMSYLKTNPTFDKAIKLPAQYETPGYYPTRYSIRTNADGSQDVALDGFTKR